MKLQEMIDLITTKIPAGLATSVHAWLADRDTEVAVVTAQYDAAEDRLLLYTAAPRGVRITAPVPLCIECTDSLVTDTGCLCTNMTVKRYHDPIFAQYAVACTVERGHDEALPCGFAAKLFHARTQDEPPSKGQS